MESASLSSPEGKVSEVCIPPTLAQDTEVFLPVTITTIKAASAYWPSPFSSSVCLRHACRVPAQAALYRRFPH